MEGIDTNILQKVEAILRKRALELSSSKYDCEIRSIFESLGGIPTGTFFLRLLNDRVEA